MSGFQENFYDFRSELAPEFLQWEEPKGQEQEQMAWQLDLCRSF